MNITDYLVEYLKQDNPVTLPGVGTLKTESCEAYFDAEKSTFYPSRRSIVLCNDITTSSDFVQYIADKECVSTSTAERIWKNYCDAVDSRFTKEGRCTISGLGTFFCEEGHFRLEAEPEMEILNGLPNMQPVENIKCYDNNDDPFAAFEQPLAAHNIVTSSFITKSDTETVTNSEPVIEDVSPTESDPVLSLTEEPEQDPDTTPEESDEPSPSLNSYRNIEPEPVDEPNPEPEEELIPTHQVEAEPLEEPTPEPEPKIEQTPIVESEQVSESEPEPEPKPEPEPESVIEHEPQAEEEPTRLVETEALNEINNEVSNNANKDTTETLQQLDAIDNADNTEMADNKQEGKKKGGFGKAFLWIFFLLIVLLAGAAVVDHYLFNSQGRNWIANEMSLEWLKTDNSDNKVSVIKPKSSNKSKTVNDEAVAATTSIATNLFSLNGLQFDNADIDSYTKQIMSTMNGYIVDYIKAHKLIKYKDIFIEKIHSYVHQRLTEELITNNHGYYPEAFMRNRGYQRDAVMPYLKNVQMHHKAAIIQTELMNDDILNQLFSEAVPDDERTEEVAPANTKPTKRTNTKPAELPVQSHIAKSSKLGFDIVAGAYVNKGTADKMCRNLKSKGCDAYIIDRNGLYYVSMGSAASRTEAEAKFDHIKKWYKEDISIKKW